MNINWHFSASDAIWLPALAAVCLLAVLLLMPCLIRYLHKLKFGQTEREEGLESHKKKSGTPTMGGLAFILIPMAVYALGSLFSPFGWNENILILFLSFAGYGMIGFLDDYIIVVRKNNEGLKPAAKFALQSVLAVVVFLLYHQNNSTEIFIPGTHASIDLGWFYFIVVFLMFTGTTNAVNLADGVDGLCAGLSFIALAPFACIAFWQDRMDIGCFLVLVMAALIGYLKYNLHPAKVFMGDTGSLALGGLLAAAAMVLKMELTLIIVGGVFIAETLSVILQVAWFKKTGKRIFRMSPLHHHFEKGGWSENKVVAVFWAWGVVFAAIGLWLGALSL